MKQQKTILCTVAYNTPLFLDLLIMSIEKHISSYHLYVFDNSDREPFHTNNPNVTILNNVSGKIINFDEWLEQFPDRNLSYGAKNKWASAKHCYTIQKLIDTIGEPFFLLDSDIIIKKDISSLADHKCVYVGEEIPQDNGFIRVAPFMCYINAPMCRKYGIKYFDPNYMHGLRYTVDNPNADMYDTGGAFYIHSARYRHKNIDIDEYISHYKNGSWDDKRSKTKHTMTLRQWIDSNKEYFMSSSVITVGKEVIRKNNKVVYTCITGDYDELRDINHEKGWDYICFTDRNITNSTWDIRPLPAGVENLTNVKKQRFIKMNPHLFLPEYEESIWIDGNIFVIGSVEEFSRMVPNSITMAFKKHPIRDCIYDEIEECAKRHKDTIENMCGLVKLYEVKGFPRHYGLYETNVIFRRHNEPVCIKLMELWSEDVLRGSHRDQLAINYRVWEQNYADNIYCFTHDMSEMHFKKMKHVTDDSVMSLNSSRKSSSSVKRSEMSNRGSSFLEKLG